MQFIYYLLGQSFDSLPTSLLSSKTSKKMDNEEKVVPL